MMLLMMITKLWNIVELVVIQGCMKLKSRFIAQELIHGELWIGLVVKYLMVQVCL